MTRHPDQLLIGTYKLGNTNIDLYGLTRESGGCFYFTPDGRSLPRMKIGFDYGCWSEVVGVLLHETAEFLCAQNSMRFQLDDDSGGSDKYRFFFDHNQFSRMCQQEAEFLVLCLPDLASSWKKYKPKT